MLSKQKRISELILEIKTKIERIQEMSDSIRMFNIKLNALIRAFDEYAIEGTTTDDQHAHTSQCIIDDQHTINDSNVSITGCANETVNSMFSSHYYGHTANDTVMNTSNMVSVTDNVPDSTADNKLTGIITYASSLLPPDIKVQQNMKRLLTLLYERKEMSINDMVCASKVSKYRIVDILGKLGGRVIGKRHDKMVYYYIINDCV